ncbi:MAG: hypothetical protein JWN30_768 [Bacilli bacterium]|nr:hypothetical protein [Bacilli bacterium]
MIALSPRLKQVADWMPEAGRFADIGSDHALLPIYLVLKHPELSAIVGEIVEGPYRAAQRAVTKHELVDRIQCRLGDGLSILRPGEVQAVSICGMGGGTIRAILEQSPAVVQELESVVLQPNTNASAVRLWAADNGWTITNEQLLADAGLLYEVIRLEKGASKALTAMEATFGPLLLREQHPLLRMRIKEELSRCGRVLEGLKHAVQTEDVQQRRAQLEQLQIELSQLLQQLK